MPAHPKSDSNFAAQRMTYSDTWTVIKEFQSLIGALVSLTAVFSAVGGIYLKARLDERSNEKKLRDSRRNTALSLYSIIRIESRFPETSLLRVPSETEVHALLTSAATAPTGLKSYIDYLLKFTIALAAFPHPISDRAHFMSWISMRIAVASTDIQSSAEANRTEAAQRYASEVRMLFVAALVVMDELADELGCYESSTEEYERVWKRSDLLGSAFRGVHSHRLDMKALGRRVWEVSLKPSTGLDDHVRIGEPHRKWLESLLAKIRLQVRGGRDRTLEPLEAIYRHCQRLPPESLERVHLERFVVAIWKRGETPVDEAEVLKLDPKLLELLDDLGEQASRSWRL